MRCVVLHPHIHPVGGDDRVAPCAGNVVVHHSHNGLGTFDGGEGGIHGGTERDVAVPIHRRDLNHSHVAGEYLLSIKCLSLTKEDGNIVGPASLHIFAHIGTHEERLGEEHAVETFLSVGALPSVWR